MITSQQILIGMAGFLHNLFTAFWVGGLLMISFTLLHASREAFGSGPQTRDLMKAILRRHRVWVYISMVGLFISGMIQARTQPAFNGLLRFDTLYSTLISIKHLLTFAMIGIALFRSLVVGKKLEKSEPQKMKQSLRLIFINTGLGVAVLFISGLIAAL